MNINLKTENKKDVISVELTAEEANIEAIEVYNQLLRATQPKKILGIFGETTGRHLLNGFGILSFDGWGSGKKAVIGTNLVPVSRVRTVDDLDEEGNRGILN